MNKYLFCVITSLLCLFFMACSDDDFKYDSPDYLDEIIDINKARNQGSGIFLDDINYFYDNYKSVMIYECPMGMLKYNGFNNVSKSRHFTPAQEEYVGDVLDFFKEILAIFPDSLHNDIIPRQILFVDSLAYVSTSGSTEKRNLLMSDTEGFAKIILGGAGEKTHTQFMSNAKVQGNIYLGCRGLFRKNLCANWFKVLFENSKLPYPDFYNTDKELFPDNRVEIMTYSNAKHYGVLGVHYDEPNPEIFMQKDVVDFLQKLFDRGSEKFISYWCTSRNDPKGLTRKKYHMFMDYFKSECGIDLERLLSDDFLQVND